MSKKSKFAMMCIVAILALCSFDALNNRWYGYTSLYMVCIIAFVTIWRIGLRVPMGYPRWLGFVGENVMILGFLHAWVVKNVGLMTLCAIGALVNIPALLERKRAPKN